VQAVHRGFWKVKQDPDLEILRRATEKIARFKNVLPGCTQSLLAPLSVPDMSAADRETFGNLAGFATMAHGCNYVLYTVFESEHARDVYEEHPIHMDLQEECLALWIGDASDSALVFDFLMP
jgi:hypothetical protein